MVGLEFAPIAVHESLSERGNSMANYSATHSPSVTNASELKNVISRLINLKHNERKEPPSKKPPIKPPTRRKKPPIKEPPDPPNPGRRRDDQVPIGDPPPKRGPKRLFRSNST